MTDRAPTVDDVQAILKLYELRREQKLRLARDWFLTRFFPQSFEDIKAITSFQNPDNIYFRMVTSYWDMAASFVNQGAVSQVLFMESAGEMLFVWAKVQDFVESIRTDLQQPRFLVNVEKLITNMPGTAERIKAIRERIARQRELAAR